MQNEFIKALLGKAPEVLLRKIEEKNYVSNIEGKELKNDKNYIILKSLVKIVSTQVKEPKVVLSELIDKFGKDITCKLKNLIMGGENGKEK